jgi:hypothetical protein
MAISQSLEMNVSIDEARQRAPTKADDLGVPTRSGASLSADCKDPAVRPCRHLRLATCEQPCRRAHKP